MTVVLTALLRESYQYHVTIHRETDHRLRLQNRVFQVLYCTWTFSGLNVLISPRLWELWENFGRNLQLAAVLSEHDVWHPQKKKKPRGPDVLLLVCQTGQSVAILPLMDSSPDRPAFRKRLLFNNQHLDV